ncbi:MAG: plastocyanin/azurin family copper-binding protein [Prolixibacteraceae bacterium]
MKTNSTLYVLRFLTLTGMLACFALNSFAQSSHLVTVTSNVYTPKELTITAGDEVVWMDTQGNHNVNGNKSIFPDNPESFGNNVGFGWTYKFVFNTPGTYNYQCDPHTGIGMFGKIIVNKNASTYSQEIFSGSGQISLFPNPASSVVELKLPTDYSSVRSLKVYSIAGSVVTEKVFSGNVSSIK